MSTIDRFVELVRGVDHDFERVVWDEATIRRDFGRRPLREIRDSEQIHYLCCLERHFLVGYTAAQADIPARLVMMRIGRLLQSVKLGTAVEFDSEEGTRTYVGAVTGDKITTEVYPSRRSYSHAHKLDVQQINPEKNWFENFGLDDADKLHEAFPGFNYQRYLNAIVRLSSQLHLQAVQQKILKKRELHPNLYI